MKTTIFTTPILSTIFHYEARILFRLFGWRIDGTLPDIPKYVLVGAPHTSNWDYILFLGVMFVLRMDARVMMKADVFVFPIGWLFRYFGGYPVDRKKSTGLVGQMVEAVKAKDKFILAIAPEGTRSYVKDWKRGFYHIAKGAGIPIVIGQLDGKNKTIRILKEPFYPTDDIEADMAAIKGKFEGVLGIKPRRKYITLEG